MVYDVIFIGKWGFVIDDADQYKNRARKAQVE